MQLFIKSTSTVIKTLKVKNHNFKDIFYIKKGAYFGEIEFFSNFSNILSVKTKDFSTVFKIKKRNFIEKIQNEIVFKEDYVKKKKYNFKLF